MGTFKAIAIIGTVRGAGTSGTIGPIELVG